jgi:hypothetical protein
MIGVSKRRRPPRHASDADASERQLRRAYVGTEPYLRKPPLVNWIIAATRALFPGHTQLPEKNQEDSATGPRTTRRVDAKVSADFSRRRKRSVCDERAATRFIQPKPLENCTGSEIRESKTQILNTPWCNGNTAPFGGVILGSNPSGVAT